MGAMFRSEEMALCQLFLQPEAAYSSLSLLGEEGIVQFRDLNEGVNNFQRKFTSEVRRCDEMERKLRYIEAEIVKENVKIPPCDKNPAAPNPRQIIDLEAQLEHTEMEIIESSSSSVNLKLNFLELTELKLVLEKTQPFFQEQEEGGIASDTNIEDRGQLGFVAGVIPRRKKEGFERMLWRISRGNVFLRQVDIETPLEDPVTGEPKEKTVFVVFYQGDQLKGRVKKVCTGFHASFYPCPSSSLERLDMIKGVKARIADLNTVLNQTKDHRQRVLSSVAKELHSWSIMVQKMKAVYHTLNLFNMDVSRKCLIGECWVPYKEMMTVQAALVEGGKAVGSSVGSFVNLLPTTEEPPTYYKTNRFTNAFHALIEAYGVGAYREVNPGLYTIITFPFLFAVMFGDAGHGLILFLFAGFMILKEKKFLKEKSGNEIWNMMFGGRYIIFLMGLFSMYTGMIYNDIFSKSANIFGSQWHFNFTWNETLYNRELDLNPINQYTQVPYWFGMDPAWQSASNKIIFLNSYKMKLSIIFGVLHMTFGVYMSTINHRFFKNYAYIFLEFIPQVLFLLLLFGYMCVLMFMKWVWYGPPNSDSIFCAPSVLITFINMMLFKNGNEGKDTKFAICDAYMYPYQQEVQMACVLVAFLCVPVMLVGKPIYLICCKKHHKEEDEEEEEASEIWIHQAIHTVEYVLSTISHTASYLRLWALSLAHAQLSEVLWQMVFRKALTLELPYYGSIAVYIIFSFWAFGTIAILVMMEGLSAFLHTLRLHWVEFCSKFYLGTGYLFVPFSFKRIIDGDSEA
ncbi:V-type proton ATPase 116 kDa subunit a1-like [Macrosteles quadrilineatus]|uniref:V-type proton ATPase 116 kDa subunit a1-like n=1 Tax=Macrosteles quadrilineatus TaxID=74068 RepID=UPI0023E1D9CD|nr:V-type proton ATPase 116 kDa subunit a1-like [Macrosteles quadrilineatus]XP_054280335.1 V-type proton ATPase 116 kDa subunit a1-like [Macrosteles quadrilineatus]